MNLFPFQKVAVDKFGIQKGVLCGDEMGTGKSFIATARDLNIRKEHQGKTLVVAPMSLLNMWETMFKNVGLTVRVVNPKSREYLLKREADVYIVHYAAMRLMPELRDTNWLHIICDEVHAIQNRQSQQTIALKRIPSEFKTGLSGTPVTNTPDKLWSILHWLYPTEWASYWRFYGKYVDFEIDPAGGYRKIKGPKNVPLLHEKMGGYFIRRLKEDVLPDLPNKYYTTINVPLTDKQFKVYEEMRKNMITWLEDAPLVAPVVIAQLMRLQQFANAYAQISPQGKVVLSEPSSKLDSLMDLIENGNQIVVFSQFSQMIDLLKKRLDKKEIPYSRITGQVPQFMRQREVDNFQNKKTQVFMGTIAAGGEGVTLTAASCVAFLDRSWSPASNSQAEDRLHRMGQENAVQVVDFIATGTVDLGRRTKLDLKRENIRKLLDPHAV